jgi:hypothetical protein
MGRYGMIHYSQQHLSLIGIFIFSVVFYFFIQDVFQKTFEAFYHIEILMLMLFQYKGLAHFFIILSIFNPSLMKVL